MKQVVVDANVLLRFLLNDVPAQSARVEHLLGEARAGKVQILVTQIVVFEIHFALDKYYGFDKKTVGEKLKAILSAQYLQIDGRGILLRAVSLWNENKVSFVDAFLAAQAQSLGVELISFDRKLTKLM